MTEDREKMMTEDDVRPSYTMTNMVAGWEAYHDPRPGDMWQEMLNLMFIVTSVLQDKFSDSLVVAVKEFTHTHEGQIMGKEVKYLSMKEFAEKIVYSSRLGKLDMTELPEFGGEHLKVRCIRDFHMRGRRYICRACKCNIVEENLVVLEERQKDPLYIHTLCEELWARMEATN